MLGRLRSVGSTVRALVAGFDPATVSAADAAAVAEAAACVERSLAALRVLAAGRAAQGEAWRASGAASAASWLASVTGASSAQAHAQLAAAAVLPDAPEVEVALRSGVLSADQAAVIAPAVVADRAAAGALVVAAGTSTLEDLRRTSRRVRAAADARGTADAQARIHAARSLRTWTDEAGAWCGRWRLTALDGARVAAVLERFHERVFDAARVAGRRDRPEAVEADALVALADAAAGGVGEESRGVRATVVARVDLAALERCATVAGEECSIDGIGPVPVPAVRSLLADAVLVALATEGERIVDVRLAGRAMPARLRHAVVARDRACVVPGCGATRHCEIHHLDPVAAGGGTFLDGLALVCRWHHDQLTHRGATLTRHPVPPGAPGGWHYTPPPFGNPGDPDVGPFDEGGLHLRPDRPPPALV